MAYAVRTPISVRFGRNEQSMLKVLRAWAKASRRTLSDEMKYLAYLGMVAKDNPDLPMSFIEGVLQGIEESRAGLSVPYEWGVLR